MKKFNHRLNQGGNITVIILLIIALAFSLFLIIPFSGSVGELREASISFLLRKPPRFISLDIMVNKAPYKIKAGESLKIRGDETLVITGVHANTFFSRYLTADIPGFGESNDINNPVDSAEIRKQLMDAGIKSLPIHIIYIRHLIAKVPIEIQLSEEDYQERLNAAGTVMEKISVLKNAHAAFPDNGNFLDSLERLLNDQGDYSTLAGIYKSILDKDPYNQKAEERLTKYYLKLGLYDEAKAISQIRLQQNPSSIAPYLQIAEIARQQGNTAERIASLEKALELGKNNEDTIIKLGQAYEDNGEKDKAFKLYQDAAPKSKNKEILVPVIQNALSSKRYKEAEPLLKRYVTLYPNDKNAMAQLGQLMGNLGDLSAQLSYYAKAAKLSPKDTVLLFNLAIAYAKAGENKNALDTFNRLLDIKPSDTDALKSAAALAQKIGRNSDAYRYYLALAQKNPSKENLNGAMGAAQALQDPDKTIEIAKLYKKDYDATLALASAYEAKAAKKKGKERISLLNDALEAYRNANAMKRSDKVEQKISDIKIELLRLRARS